jgi:hypothetical protein
MSKEKKPAKKKTPTKGRAKESSTQNAAPSKRTDEEIAAKPAASVAPAPAAPPVSNEQARRVQPPAAELYDEIRRRAYEFYIERGGQHGSHEADWHRAEYEVRSKYKA